MSDEVTAVDSYGRRTVFRGDLLISDTTDTEDSRKPQWLDIDIWRTEGGSYVVRRAIHYRVVHARKRCPRLEGYEIRPADGDDTYCCPRCVPEDLKTVHPGWSQESRVTVDVYREPEQLIDSLQVDGRHTRLSRTLLADLSEQDARIDALWNTVEVD